MIDIYVIRNSINGKIYIGQTRRSAESRWKQHVAASKNDWSLKYSAIARAIAKHGPESFSVSVLIGGIKTTEEANESEIRMIAKCRSRDPRFGYNLHPGGSYGGDTAHHGNWGDLASSPLGKNKKYKPICVPYRLRPHVLATAERVKAASEKNTRIAIEAPKIATETYYLFPLGCAVRRVRDFDPSPEKGIVEGYGLGGYAIYGFNAISCLKIRWDGRKTISELHRKFVERIPESA